MKPLLMLLSLLQWLGLSAIAAPLEIGNAIPAREVTLEDGSQIDLAEQAARGYTLVYFYPKANTPGCTAQACSLRDAYSELQERGVRIFGVSADGVEAQAKFKAKHQLPFSLIADPQRELIKAFGVPLMVGMPRRQAYLFKEGALIWKDEKASTSEQAADLLKVLETEQP